MSNYNLRLEFEEAPLFEKGGKTVQRGWIALQAWTHADDDGTPHISPECMSAGEVVANVERLKKELDAIADEAKRRFRR